MSGEPLCRWHNDGLVLDMMPTDPTVLGFGASAWFRQGFDNAGTFSLPNDRQIYAFDALHLLAAKIEAFEDRGEGDWLLSRDVEDIVTILDGRTTIFEELAGQEPLHHFIHGWFFAFPGDELRELLTSHTADYARGDYLHERLTAARPL